MSAEHTCPRCNGMRMYRKCVHGCDGKKPEDVLRERQARRQAKRKAEAASSSLARTP